MRKLLLCFGSVFLFLSIHAQAQEIVKIITIDNTLKGANESLPFDRPIILKYITSEPFVVRNIGLLTIPKKEYKDYYSESYFNHDDYFPELGKYNYKELKKTSKITSDNKNELDIFINPLAPNKFYDIAILRAPNEFEASLYEELFGIFTKEGTIQNIEFESKLAEINKIKTPFENNVTDQETMDLMISFYNKYLKGLYAKLSGDVEKDKVIKNEIKKIVKSYDPNAVTSGHEDFFIFPDRLSIMTKSLNFDTRTSFTLTADFGYVNYGFQKSFYGITPYIGAQIEFRYFDKNIPFRLINHKTIWHYLSFCTGVTLSSLKKTGRREDLFTGKSLLMGLGVRLTNAVRLTFGGILFNSENANSLIDKKKVSITPFAGLSIDLKLKSVINDLVGLNVINKK